MKLTQLFSLLSLGAIAATASLGACATDRTDKLTIGNDACGHFADDTGEPANAGASRETAADVSTQHQRYDLTLVNDASGRGGFVKVTIPAAGDYTFLFDATVTVVMTDAASAPVTAAASVGQDPDCATMGTEDTYTLSPGTYTLGLGTTSDDPLLLVWMHEAIKH